MSNIILRKEAKELNLKYYFTGKPCKHGHTSDRATRNGECQGCSSARHNSEKFKEQKRAYSKHLTTSGKRKQYRDANRSKINKNKRAWSTNWRKTPEGVIQKRIDASTRRACIRNQTPELTSYEKQRMKDIYYRAWCYSQVEVWDFHVDHIVALAKGGLHHPDNLQILEAKVNLLKRDQ